MTAHEWLAACVVYLLALWVVLSGLDDLWIDAVFFRLRLWNGLRKPSDAALDSVPQRRIAVFVPLWREDSVIRGMLEHNLAAVRYGACDFFVGVYPNDPETAAAVTDVASRFANVHLATCPHPGPTSKADCLNWAYQRMLLYEEAREVRFDAVVIHDAEDLIHPESLRLINYHLEKYDMVQVPVLPLPTPLRQWTHGLYCDEFAEFQTKDIPVRQFLGGFIASNGVGTGFSRNVLDALAGRHANRIFEPACLTEDYDAGYRIHALGRRQLFTTIQHADGGPVATREYFPRTFSAAVRQRTRWVMGISLQGWERQGWRAPARQGYWLWRDRKGLAGNLLNPVMNALFVWGAVEWLSGSDRTLMSDLWNYPGMPALCVCMLGLSGLQLAIRTGCSWRLYGGRFAVFASLRAIYGNFLNGLATVLALWRYFGAKLRGEPLVWFKTDHIYPGREALMPHKRRLGEILVTSGKLQPRELEEAVAARVPGERLGECLVRTGKLNEDDIYAALSVQQGLPFGKPARASGAVRGPVPVPLARKWGVVPVEVQPGQLFVAGPEPPSEEMARELERCSKLKLRFWLITPTDYRRLSEEYLRN